MARKVSNGEVLERIGEKRAFLNNIIHRKVNWVGHILRRNYLLHDVIERQTTGVKGLGRRRTLLLHDLRKKKILGAKGES
jgi:hypothetical protein